MLLTAVHLSTLIDLPELLHRCLLDLSQVANPFSPPIMSQIPNHKSLKLVACRF
jgi:hypothetical protein